MTFMGLSQALYQAGVGVKGTDVPTWISIMSERSVPHLQKGTAPAASWLGLALRCGFLSSDRSFYFSPHC